MANYPTSAKANKKSPSVKKKPSKGGKKKSPRTRGNR